MLRDRQTCNVVQIGLGMFFVFFAFTSQGFIVETVLSEKHKVDSSIPKNAGYYSQTIVYGTFIVSNAVAPIIIKLLTPKWSLVFGSFGYTLYMVGFQFLNSYYLYVSSAVEGLGAGIMWTAFGHCIAINSNEHTVARNSSIAWIIYSSSFIFGGIFLLIMFRQNEAVSISESTTRQIYGSFACVCFLGNIVFALLPSRMEIERSENTATLPTSTQEPISYRSELRDLWNLVRKPNMLLLCFIFAYSGMELSFWSAVYSTSLSFTKQFKVNTDVLLGLNSICVGIGELIAGTTFGVFGHHTNKLGHSSIVFLGVLVALISYILAAINLPGNSSYEDSYGESLISPSIPIALIVGIMLGFTDACVNTQIYSFITKAYKHKTREAFAIHKFFHAILCTVCMFYGSDLKLQWQLTLLAIGAIISALTFFMAESRYKISKRTEQ